MARFPNPKQATSNARANAKANPGESWVVFSDTSGGWNSERYNPSAPCHNDGSATVHTFKPDPDPALEVMADHYVIAALWSSSDDLGIPLDDPKYEDRLTKQARTSLRAEAIAWGIKHRDLLKELEDAADEVGYGTHKDCGPTHPVYGAAGHDLWLTRNGHGVGFWDRDLGALGDRLTDAAKKAGESGLYVSRGRIYHYPA